MLSNSRLAQVLGTNYSSRCPGAISDVSLGAENSGSVADALDKRDIPYVLATGGVSSNVTPRFKDTLILTKPFKFEEVKVSLEKLLSERQSSSAP
jgi:hypothetical protein